MIDAFSARRGISITATALQFSHQALEMTLLDTPGHEDFSEDTLRVMAAADSAELVDAASLPFDTALLAAGEQAAVRFGSAACRRRSASARPPGTSALIRRSRVRRDRPGVLVT